MPKKKKSVCLGESSSCWGKAVQRGSSQTRLKDVGSLFTMKEGFRQVQGRAGESVQDLCVCVVQCSEFMRLEGVTYLLFRILGMT